MSVLIVEDNEIFRDVLRAAISSRFPRVDILEASGVAAAFQIAQRQTPKLVLVDLQLPDGSGMDLAARISKEFPDSVVAIVTSYDNPEYRAAARAHGIGHFIPKDQMSPDRVLGLVEATLYQGACKREEIIPSDKTCATKVGTLGAEPVLTLTEPASDMA